ncbi:hemagglutinin repeat-containing protein, partial [Ursidibacter sp. B-7004-1]
TSSGKITAQGKSTASGDITLSAKMIDANDSQKNANTISVISTTGNIDAARAIWSANDKLNIQTPTTFSTVGGEFNAHQWKVNAERVDNQTGRWFAIGNAPLTLDLPQGLNNLGGVIQNQGNIDIHTHTAGIDNQQGIIKSLKGSISTQSSTPLLNGQGKLVAGKTLSIDHFGLNNQQGYMLAQQGNATIKLYQNSLVNQQGNILAGEHLNITSGTLTNLQGTLYSGKNTTIHTHLGELNNQEQGKVIAGSDISLQAQEIWNDSGIIDAKNNATLTVTEQLDNQKSTTQGSLVQAGNTLSISAQKLDNSRTKTTDILPESGLVASTLNVTTAHLDNHQGGIYTLVNSTLWLTTLLNNQQGEIRSTGDLHIQGNELSVENQQGEIHSIGHLTINTHSLSSLGQISGGETALNMVKDFDSQTDIVGKQSLNITTQGKLVNRATLHSSGKLHLNAIQIENNADASIKGQSVELNTPQTFINRGLVNALGDTVIRVGQTLQNIGTGRIYGNHIALQADTLINEDERINGEIKSGVIAARARLDIGANHIINQQYQLKPAEGEKSGVTLSSDGEMVFGQQLNEQNEAIGLAKTLRNTSSIIEVANNLTLNVIDMLNSNQYIHNVLTEKSRTPVNESYLVSGNTLRNGERINFEQLKWVGFSRAGKVVFNNTSQKPENPEELATQVLPMPNEMVCQNVAEQTGCVPTPKSLYLPDDPIWTYFGITPPTQAPALPDVSYLDPELDAPVAPSEPRRRRLGESEDKYQARLKQYDADKATYQVALQAYEAEQAKYQADIQPYLDWAEQNKSAFEQLEEKIQAHNGKLQGRQFLDFWINNVKERVIKEDVATDSVPGQILVGRNLTFSGNLTNNQSTILAGGTISNTQNPTIQVVNNDQWGERIIDDHGTEQWTYSRWRGGVKRYHQRKWGSVNAYIHETRTDIPLQVVNTQANSVYQKITQNAPLANGEVLLNETAIHTQPSNVPDFAHTSEIRSIGVDKRLPNSSLYKVQLNPASHVLIETDPEFTDNRRWLSSDYMFNALRHEHENVHKRLGDGYYEQRLVREQINQLTGRMFNESQHTFESQYQALMDAGISFAQRFNLRPGIALSPTQVASLTSDIVWFEPTEITLADGSVQQVLAPRVYVVARKGDIDGLGTLIGGENITLNHLATLQNSGTIYGRHLTTLNANELDNSGTLSGAVTTLSGNKLLNLGGVIEGEQATVLKVKDIDLRSTIKTSEINLEGFSRTQTNLSRQALIHTKNADGILVLEGENLTMTGAKIQNSGKGLTDIHLTEGINLNGLAVGFDEKMGGGNHYRNQSENSTIVSHISGNGQVQIRGKHIYSEGANLDAGGKLITLAENEMVLGTAKRTTTYEEYHKTKSGSAVSRKTTTQYDNERELTHKGTEITGDSIYLHAKQNIRGESLLAVSKTGDVELVAENDINLTSATNTLYEKHLKTTKRNGLLNGGELGFTIGSQTIRQEDTLNGAIQSTARNTLASEQGNVTLRAGNRAFASNLDVIVANDKNATISGKQGARLVAGKDVIQTTDKYEFSQSGLSIALSTPVTDAIQSAHKALQQAKATKNDKLKGVYAVKAAEDAVIAAQNAQKVADTLGQLGKGMEQNAAAAENPAVKISVSVGTQKQTRESESNTLTHAKSNLNAGNVTILSEEGKVELEGVDTNVKGTLKLDGKDGIVSKGVMDTYDNKTTNKNHSASVGVFVGANGDSYGIGIEASASVGKGKENSHSEMWQNNQLQAEKLVTYSDNGKLTLDATNVKADRWEGNVQELELISRQDVTKYDSKQVQAGGSVSVTYGSGGGANFNASYNAAKLNTAQVENQTSVDIGKGGMEVKVRGNTHLEGATISSQADKANNRFQTGTLTTNDIQNHSELKTESVAISGGSGGINPLSALSLLGNKNESSQSTTKAAIGENIDITLTDDPNAETTLKNLNRDTQNANQKVTKHDLAEVRETQELVKGIGEIADKAMQIYTHNEREKIEQAKLALGKAKQQAKERGVPNSEIENDPQVKLATKVLVDKQQA